MGVGPQYAQGKTRYARRPGVYKKRRFAARRVARRYRSGHTGTRAAYGQHPRIKSVDNYLQIYVPSAPGVNSTTVSGIDVLSSVNQGTAQYLRIGNKVVWTGISVDFIITPNADAAVISQIASRYRVAIVYDRNTIHGGVITVNDVWDGFTQSGTELSTVLPGSVVYLPKNPSLADRFTIIKEWYGWLPGLPAGGTTNPIWNPTGSCDPRQHIAVKEFIKVPNLMTQYNADGVSGSLTQTWSGAIYIFAFCTNGNDGTHAANTTAWILQGNFRMWFKDV